MRSIAGRPAAACGRLAMSGEAMPLIMNLDDERLEERGKEASAPTRRRWH